MVSTCSVFSPVRTRDSSSIVRVSNPAGNQELLDELGKRFTAYRYDFKKLVKDICTSRAYQRATQPTATYDQLKELNRQGRNLGPALVRLVSKDVPKPPDSEQYEETSPLISEKRTEDLFEVDETVTVDPEAVALPSI